MPGYISEEQHNAEVIALKHDIYRLSRELEAQKQASAPPDCRDPFRNPTEYHESRKDYTSIAADLSADLPIVPEQPEKKRLKRCYSVGGGCMLIHFLLSDYIASALLTLAIMAVKAMNPDAGLSRIYSYLRASSVLAGITMLVYMLTNVGVAMLGLRLAKEDKRDLIRTRNFSIGIAAQYCLIGVFLLFVSAMGTYLADNLFSKYGQDIDVLSTNGMATSYIGKAVMLIYTCIIAPVTEEIFYRGMLLKVFSRANQRFGIFFTALMFGLAHANIPQFILTFILGTFMAHITLKHGSIIPAIIVHAFVNTFSTVLSESNFHGIVLVIANEVFLVLALLGAAMLLVFRLNEKIPATTPAQSRRGLAFAMATPLVLLATVIQFLYMLSLMYSSPLLDFIRTYL